jgi:hypothetical protein
MRYFVSRGPATVHDFSKWSGWKLVDAERGLAAIELRLEREVDDDRAYWFSSSVASGGKSGLTACLLSVYDEYFSSYRDRGTPDENEVWVRPWAIGNALSYVVILDGRIVATCKRIARKDAVSVEVTLPATLTAAGRRAIGTAGQRYGEFLGLPAAIVHGDCDVAVRSDCVLRRFRLPRFRLVVRDRRVAQPARASRQIRDNVGLRRGESHCHRGRNPSHVSWNKKGSDIRGHIGV